MNIDSFILPTIVTVDMVLVKITADSGHVYVLNVYVPPSASSEVYLNLFESISNIERLHNNNLLIVGDFNISSYATYFHNNLGNDIVSALTNFLPIFNLTQYNTIANDLERILDLVLYNNDCFVERSIQNLVAQDRYHPVLNISCKLNFCHTLKRNFPTISCNEYNFRKANFSLLYQSLSNIDWTFLQTFDRSDDACIYFYGKLYNAFDECVPRETKQYKRKYPPWFTRDIIKDIKLKSKLNNECKINNDVNTLNKFKYLRAKVKSDIDKSYRDYANSAESSMKADPKKFWAFVNSKKGSTNISDRMTFNGQTLDTPTDILNGFSEYFAKSFSVSTMCVTHDDSVTSQFLNIMSFTEDEVLIALKQVKNKMTTGPDSVPAFILKDCAPVLAPPLTILLNTCVKTSTVPNIWKSSKVRPIYKHGDRVDISNYRPISIICNFCKVFEMLLYNRMYSHLCNIITIKQHGFVKGRSTVTNLANITQFIAENIDERSQTDVVYTDFSKAFDRLDHGILVSKLSRYGLSPSLIKLFTYLNNRHQYVVFNGYKSVEYLATSGVPQGSNLGPLLFNVFINDIVDDLDVNCLLYADDLKLFCRIGDRSDCISLSTNLRRIERWCISNKLSLNACKCKVMTFSLKPEKIIYDYEINNIVLERPATFIDLGVTFDSKLSFIPHIEAICSSANKMYGFLVRNSWDFNDQDTLKALYFAYVRSKIEYADVIWSPFYDIHIQKLESIQRRFLKFLSFKMDGIYPPVGVRTGTLQTRHCVNNLSARRDCHLLIFLFKIMNNNISDPNLLLKLQFNTPRVASRAVNTFYLTTPRTNILKFSPLYRMCSICNHVSYQLDIFHCRISAIKAFFFD